MFKMSVKTLELCFQTFEILNADTMQSFVNFVKINFLF